MISETCTHLERSSRRFAARAGVAVWLRRTAFPRLAITFAIVLGAITGVGCSIAFHRCGLNSMSLRYPLALIAAYVSFLAVVGIWVARAARRVDDWQKQIRRESLRRQRRNTDVDPELGDWVGNLYESFDDARHQLNDQRALPAAFLLLLSLTIILVCIYFIWTAPAFLAELVVEGALVAWLYRPPQRYSSPGWLTVALERTAAPALMMFLCLAGIGIGFQICAPEATTIVDVLQHVRAANAPRGPI